MEPIQIYILLVLLGMVLFGIELFVPGGILGAIGAFLLLIAVGMGFMPSVFGPTGGFVSALLIVIGSTAYALLLLRYLPSSPIGRLFTLSSSMKESSAVDPELPDLLGKEGTAETDLRPSGIAVLEDQRVDVVADGEWIAARSRVKVIEVNGNRVVVQEIEA